MCGIYKITNKLNGHFYIGQSVDIKARWRCHCYSSRHLSDKDHYSPIHLAIHKYGQENFIFEVLELCPENLLDEKEIYWIEKLQATQYGNYNILKGGQDVFGFEEKPVELYDLAGNYIKTLPSATLAARELDTNRSFVYQTLHKQRPTCKGYQMKYVDDKNTIMTKFVSRQGGSIPVQQLDIVTNKVIATYPSAAEASRTTGADSSAIIKVCKGKMKTTFGYKWKYMEVINCDTPEL